MRAVVCPDQSSVAYFKESNRKTSDGCSTNLKPVWSEVAT